MTHQLMSRRWPCMDCRKPYTAVRDGTRCKSCADLYQRQRSHAANTKARHAHRRDEPRPQSAAPATVPVVDPAIELYRAERKRREARRAEESYWTDAAIGAARELLLADATPGGPRVRRDGTERKTHYNSTFARGGA